MASMIGTRLKRMPSSQLDAAEALAKLKGTGTGGMSSNAVVVFAPSSEAGGSPPKANGST
jgi:hypothetical protein